MGREDYECFEKFVLNIFGRFCQIERADYKKLALESAMIILQKGYMSRTIGENEKNPERIYLRSYDISDNRIKNKVAKAMESFGKRVQYSVFECSHLPQKQYERMVQKLTELMEGAEGSIRVYYLCVN